MDKLLRTLIEKDEISLVAVDSSEMVRHAQIIHGMNQASAEVFGRILTVACYMTGWLKEENSEISINFKHHGTTGETYVSGGGKMNMRGYIFNPQAQDNKIGKGYMTVVRDDNYKKPFVGTCEMVSDDVDANFEYYYRLSEQLPTYIRTAVAFDEYGLCVKAGGIFLQPMPGAAEIHRQFAKNAVEELTDLAERIKNSDMGSLIGKLFGTTKYAERKMEYRCKCSKEYISGVLKGMGEAELRDIIKAEGKINVHCHYCNSDYDFFNEDIDEWFKDKQ